jgi:flagellar biosynthesis protein FlhB
MAEPSSTARTEEPTPRRLAEARRQGQVAVSAELTGAGVLLAVLVALVFGAAAGAGQLAVYLRTALARAATADNAVVALGAGVKQAIALLLLPLGVAWVVTLAAGLAQTGGLLAPRAARFEPRRAWPSIGRVLDTGTLAAVGKGAAGALLLFGVACLTLAPLLPALAGLSGASAGRVLAALGTLARLVGWRMALVMVGLGGLDLVWRRYRHRRSLRMTRDEVERERRQHEGDPHRKIERRRLHREAVAEGGGGSLVEADFLVTGPRVAFALGYRGGPAAPVLVGRGERLVAARLIELARAQRLPTFHDPMLAQALAAVHDGEEIPAALHGPVAHIVKVILEASARSA